MQRLQRTGWVMGLVFAGFGSVAALADEELAQTPVLRIEPKMHTAPIYRIGVDGACTRMVTGSIDKTARLWDISDTASRTPKLLRTLRPPIGPGNDGKIFAVALSPDGKWIAAGGWNVGNEYHVYLFEAATGRLLKRLGAEDDVNLHLAFSPDGRYLAATYYAGEGLRVWETGGWTLTVEDRDYGGAHSYGAAFDGAGRLWTVADDGRLRRYDARPGNRGFKVPPNAIETGGGKRPFGVAALHDCDGAMTRRGQGFDRRMEWIELDFATISTRHSPVNGQSCLYRS